MHRHPFCSKTCLLVAGLILGLVAATPASAWQFGGGGGTGGVFSDRLGENLSEIPEPIRQLLQDREYTKAVEAIDQAMDDEKAPQECLAYLKGRALYLAEQFDAAAEAFERVEKDFESSIWARRARFARALALARKGDFQSAELIYGEMTAQLLSQDRKQEIADIYLEFADGFFKPADERQAPDYTKSLEFYLKALEVGPRPARRAEIELRIARCYQLLGNLDEAVNRYSRFSQEHPAGDLAIEARFLLGETHLAAGRLEEARRMWQDLLAAFGDDKSERIGEAMYQVSLTYNMPQPTSDTELDLGVAALKAFVARYPDHKLASQAHLRIAAAYQHRARYDDAVRSLEEFLADPRYADRDEVPDARNMLGRSYLLASKFDEALAAWRDYLAKHPAHGAWSEVQQAVVNAEFLRGLAAFEKKQYDEARRLWEEFLAQYPLDGRNPRILYEFGHIDYIAEKWDEAMAQWRRLVSKYPGTEESSRAQLMIAVVLEEKLARLSDALAEYKKVTWGAFQAEAQQRIARLTTKSMVVVTPGVFRTDETPKIKLTTRNIERVTVRAYRVDLETYFRKMHLAGGVEGLDIALIDPDVTFEFPVLAYAEYQQIESEIEIPLPPMGEAGAAPSGVMAVTVSSPTLEATTQVIQSDLDVIVKSSRDEVFVFAENMRTLKPWPGVRLLVSDGQQVFAEAETDDSGVFQKSYEQLKGAADVRVFAVAEGNVASNVVSLDGVGVAQGLTDRGYIYTDRSAYRAGQIVHVRGIVRTASADAFQTPSGKSHRVEIFDSRNRLIWQEELKLNEFGSFHSRFTLPPSSAVGDYRVQVSDFDNHSYQGAFVVHEYQLEPVRLSVDTPRRVYYRGEEIEGKIIARFYYGAPVADREIRYQLAGGRVFTARTNEAGELEIKLPTREFRESQVLPLVVTLADRNLQTTVNFVLATQGFSIALSTVRPVYVAGETFELALATSDAEGKPASQKLVLRVLEQTSVDGKVGEREVERHEVTTGEKDGKARLTLRLEEGAAYVLRAEGTDRFQNPVSTSHVVQVSDDKDTVRLRILADAHTYNLGDTAQVQLHWREEPALALVTFQGARVLDYKLIELQTGSNRFEFPLSENLAPNFELAVAVMTDADPPANAERAASFSRFHAASSPFTVQRELRVSIEQPRREGQGPPQPGEEIEIVVTTTDAHGNAVPAELSLALVEQSLWDLFGSNVSPIQEFFRGQERKPDVRTTSSVTFAYRPSTRPIDPRLLAEEDRLALAAEEAERLRAGGVESRALAGVEFNGELPELVGRNTDPTTWDESTTLMFGALADQPAPASPEMAPPSPMEGESNGDLPESNRYNAGFAYGKFAGATVPGLRERMVEGAALGRHYNAPADAGAVAGRGFAQGGGTAWNKAIQQKAELLVLHADGRQDNFAGRTTLGDQELAILATELAQAGALLLPVTSAQETGYWNPVIVTDDEGRATLTLTLPERTTAWKLLAKGINRTALAGEAEGELVVKKDLFGELKLPLAFTDGDEAQVQATIHNESIEGAIEVTLRTTLGDSTVEERKTLEAGKGIHDLDFKVALSLPVAAEGQAPRAESVEFELTVAAGERRDVVRRTIGLNPFGMRVFATAGGSADSDMTAFVEPAPQMPLTSPTLQILVGPTVERSLLDVLLGAPPMCQLDTGLIVSGLDTATSDIMAAVALQRLMAGTRDAGGPYSATLDTRVRGSLALLVSSQADDGGWSWSGGAGASDRLTSARATWALSLARSAGYAVSDDVLERALTYVAGQVTAVADSDHESKAILLHALSVAGRGDFALANRLYRNRPAMSPSGLAHLALALVEMDRAPMAADILEVLSERNLDDAATRRTNALSSLPWSGSGTEIRALYLMALERAVPQSPRIRELVDWLLSHRVGHRWAPDKATGPATLALAHWFASSRFESDRYALTVFVNDFEAAKLEFTADSTTQVVEVPANLLRDGKQRVQFQLAGRGRFTYQCVLGGFVPADKLASTTNDWRVERHYEPAPRELDGEPIPRGFGILEGGYTPFRNPLTQLPVGQRGHVELVAWRNNVEANTPDSMLDYLVITEPLPSGVTVVPQSVQGGFERFEITPGAITFYVGSRHYVEPIHFDIHGYLSGQYRAAPTVVRNPYRPGQLAVAQTAALAVLPLGSTSGDEYKLTPQELFEFGKRRYARGELKSAGAYLTELVSNWQLQPDFYRESVRMLLDVHLDQGPNESIVRYFELIKEKWSDIEIPFDKIVKVAAAYHAIGEYERSYLVFRATVEGSFQGESSVAGFLEAQGEFVRSVAVMNRLLAEYPPEAYAAAAQYALAQRVYAYAPQAATDVRLRERKINRVDLVRQALTMLDGFLTDHPHDPAADQASFSLANALLELKAYRKAIERCGQFADRYPTSDFLDSFWYVTGYCHFALGEHEEALAMCRKVAETTRTDQQSGREVESKNKWRAIYILGQVYHSLGQAADAIREYTQVADRFADAAAAIAYFARQEIAVAEVSTFKPGEPVDVELKFRNVARCDVRVYKIDLMKFSLLKRSLGGITQINLAGIRPYHEAALELGNGQDYRDRTRELTLPLDDEGAYLVVVRGNDLHASGLVLVTPLEVEVQEEAASGQVRATVKDKLREGYVSDVHVKVIGTRNTDFVSGETDLRGVFVADAIQGNSTVIAQADGDRYAFYRGKLDLGPPPPPQSSAGAEPMQQAGEVSKPQGEADLLEDLQQSNRAIQVQQEENLQNLYKQNKKGVQASEAY